MGRRLFSLIKVMMALFILCLVEEPMRRQMMRPINSKTVAIATAPKPTAMFLILSPLAALVFAAASILNRIESSKGCSSFVIQDDLIQWLLSLGNRWPCNACYSTIDNFEFPLFVNICYLLLIYYV